jgi:serine/threonine protein kinase
MEYLEAETLSARIERDGPLPEPELREIVRQLLAALTAAHEAGVIHRDLKSGNIMLAQRPDGTLPLVVSIQSRTDRVGREGKDGSGVGRLVQKRLCRAWRATCARHLRLLGPSTKKLMELCSRKLMN